MIRTVLICILLAGCATTAPLPQAPAKPACLPLTFYTPAEETALGAALGELTDGNPLISGWADYGKMRAADRACMGLDPQ